MKASWTIDAVSLSRWRALVEKNRHKPIPQDRQRRNVERRGLNLSSGRVWREFVACQLTTQQRSGTQSRVAAFLQSDSFVLRFDLCNSARNLPRSLKSELSQFRFGSKNADNLVNILAQMKGDGWRRLKAHLHSIKHDPTSSNERIVAQYLSSDLFPGLGPKQSRNFIQGLGLSRFEVPIDKRVLKVMKQMGCNFVPSQVGLGDEAVYLFAQEGLQLIARSLDIYPCILDACMFANSED